MPLSYEVNIYIIRKIILWVNYFFSFFIYCSPFSIFLNCCISIFILFCCVIILIIHYYLTIFIYITIFIILFIQK